MSEVHADLMRSRISARRSSAAAAICAADAGNKSGVQGKSRLYALANLCQAVLCRSSLCNGGREHSDVQGLLLSRLKGAQTRREEGKLASSLLNLCMQRRYSNVGSSSP